jgi:hypothetical protein
MPIRVALWGFAGLLGAFALPVIAALLEHTVWGTSRIEDLFRAWGLHDMIREILWSL